jgi:hypothetical protein
LAAFLATSSPDAQQLSAPAPLVTHTNHQKTHLSLCESITTEPILRIEANTKQKINTETRIFLERKFFLRQ